MTALYCIALPYMRTWHCNGRRLHCDDEETKDLYINFCASQAYERRFPTCPQIPVFVGCEVTHDEESKDGAVRTTERRCKLNVEAPYILKKVCLRMHWGLWIILSGYYCCYYKIFCFLFTLVLWKKIFRRSFELNFETIQRFSCAFILDLFNDVSLKHCLLFQIIGVDFVYFIQRNVLDRRNSVLEIEAYNESFATRVTVLEKCRYFVSITKHTLFIFINVV